MRASLRLRLATFAGSLALAGIGLALIARRETACSQLSERLDVLPAGLRPLVRAAATHAKALGDIVTAQHVADRVERGGDWMGA